MADKASDLDVRARILVVATHHFAEHGFSTSIQKIAEAVGVRKQSLLYWFKTKQDLRLAVLDALLGHWKQQVPELLLAARTGEDRLGTVMEAMLGYFETDPVRARLLMRAMLDSPDEMQDRLHKHIGPWMGLITEYVRLGQQQGRVRPGLDPEAWLVGVVTSAVGTFALPGVAAGFGMAEVDEAEITRRRRAALLAGARHSLFVDNPPTGST